MTAETMTTMSADATIHPGWVRVSHWINAIAILVMIGSGWQIYDASPLFRFRLSQAHRARQLARPARCSGISPPCGCW